MPLSGLALFAGMFAQLTSSPAPAAGRAQPGQAASAVAAPDSLRIEIDGLPKKRPPVRGEYPVRPDGSVALTGYGAVRVAGLTPEQCREAVVAQVAKQFKQKRADRLIARVEVVRADPQVYYVITATKEGSVASRLPYTGSPTVLDAVARMGGLPAGVGTNVWVARAGRDSDQILPVDWLGITAKGDTTTNYILMPRDRVCIGVALAK